MLRFVTIFVFVALVISVALWGSGLIILPEMGLQAPGYLPWLAIGAIKSLIYTVNKFLKELEKSS